MDFWETYTFASKRCARTKNTPKCTTCWLPQSYRTGRTFSVHQHSCISAFCAWALIPLELNGESPLFLPCTGSSETGLSLEPGSSGANPGPLVPWSHHEQQASRAFPQSHCSRNYNHVAVTWYEFVIAYPQYLKPVGEFCVAEKNSFTTGRHPPYTT